MRFPTATTFALAVLLVAATMGAVAAAPSAASPSADERSPPRYALDDPVPLEPDDPAQVIRLNVTDDGDTRWTIESRFRLESTDDVDTFTAYADEVASGQRGVGYDVTMFQRFANEAERSTGREMDIVDAGWDEPRIVRNETTVSGDDVSEAEPATGVVSYSFRWTNFAQSDGARLRFGDAVVTEDGLLLDGLADGQRLVVEWPNNYGFASPPSGGYTTREDGALVWDGPHEFSDDELQIVFLRGAFPVPWEVVGVVLLVLVLGATGYLVSRSRWSPGRPSFSLGRGGAGDEEDASSVAYTEDDASDAGSAPGDESDVDVALLSDEERVRQLLRQNGGRMKQAAIVTETGWSNAKVSQLLSRMDEDDQINKLRIGRENLITLPDVDLTEIG